MSGYAEKLNRLPDFEVSYRFYSEAEGGRKDNHPVFQNYRSNWSFDGDDIEKTGLFPIWPEFLDSHGEVWPDANPVPISGKATMWITFREVNVPVHRARIKKGTKGYFMEGRRRVAEAVVTRIIGLHTNKI
jgi:hypothetical protein